MLCETSLSRASLFRLLIIFGISRLWALGIGGRSLPYIEDAYREIDNEIWKHVEESSDDELDKLAIEDLGIYTIDDDPMF